MRSAMDNRMGQQQHRENPASRRRRKMAFMKYGSDRDDRTREHARQIAMKLSMDTHQEPMNIQSDSTFADFGAAFPVDNEPSQDASFEEASWPSQNRQSMFSMPANSSMQSNFTRQPAQQQERHEHMETSSRRQTPSHSQQQQPQQQQPQQEQQQQQYSPAVRRRLRKTGKQAELTPPHSPHSSVASNTPPRRSSQQQQQQYQQQQQSRKSSNRVAPYASNSARRPTHQSSRQSSVNSSTDGSSEANLFDVKGGGFTFDAFGLDAAAINREVSAAMHEMNGTSDSFAFATEWDNSPNPSRTSTPVGEGFVDGFRISKPSPSTSIEMAMHETPSAKPVNLYKDSPGFQQPAHGSRRGVASSPAENKDKKKRTVRNRVRKPVVPAVTRQDALLETPISPRAKHDVEFYDDSSHSSSRNSGLARSDVGTDVGVASDVGVSSEYEPSRPQMPMEIPLALEVSKKKSAKKSKSEVQKFDVGRHRKEQDSQTASTESTSHDEKKEEFEDAHSPGRSGFNQRQWQSKNPAPLAKEFQSIQRQERDSTVVTTPKSVREAVRASVPKHLPVQAALSKMRNSGPLSPASRQQSPSQERKAEKVSRPWERPAVRPSDAQVANTDCNKQDQDDARSPRPSFQQLRNSIQSQLPESSQSHNKEQRTAPLHETASHVSHLASRSPVKKTQVALTPQSLGRHEARPDRMGARSSLKASSNVAKSEAGATMRQSHVNKILNNLDKPASPRDTMSDVGTLSAPSFAGLKLRKTGRIYDTSTTPVKQEEPERRTVPSYEAPQEPPVQEPEPPVERKLTYRERREMELAKEKEEKEAAQRASEKKVTPQRDVKALIKRRIASAKKQSPTQLDPTTSGSPEAPLTEQRLRLKPVSSPTNDQNSKPPTPTEARQPVPPFGQLQQGRGYEYDQTASPSQLNAMSSSPQQSPRYESPRQETLARHDAMHAVQSVLAHRSVPRPFCERGAVAPSRRVESEQNMSASKPPLSPSRSSAMKAPSDLVIESEELETKTSGEAGGAVSHMLMLQQLQQKKQPVSPVPISPMKTKVETADTDSAVGSPLKTNTPKATMMMLNAFLAGRESIGGDGVAGSVPEQDTGSCIDSTQAQTTEAAYGLPALKDDPKYKRFFKMLSIGLPMDVVKHAMTREGLDPSVMDGDHRKPVGVPLKLDPTYSKYFRMLSIGLPMEAVKHSMARDGLDPSVMDQDHSLPVKLGSKPSEEEEKEKDSHRRARLHWKTLRKVTSNSLWAKIDQEDNVSSIMIDEQEFQELFQVERGVTVAAKPKDSESSRRGATVRVIEPKRANNGGIILARLKMSHDEMANAVERINEYAMNAEQIEHIIEYLPTKEERKALEAYMLEGGQDAAEKFEGLCECEKFMVSMMTVKHAKRKVRALLFKLQFETCVRDIQEEAFLVEEACDELSRSARLRNVLGFILEFGNRLNTAGNGKKKAGAFTLDSLLKLNQAKAFDKKTTFLNFIVRMMLRNNEDLTNFADDIPTVFKADRVAWDQCLGDLEEVENQLENVRRISLYQARQAQAYRLRRRNKNREDDEESLSGNDALSLEEEVEALKATPVGCFTLGAIKYISALRDKVEDTKAKFARLLEYFGEEDKQRQPHELYKTVATFCRDFQKAKEEVIANEKKRQREEKKRQKKAGVSSSKPPQPQSPKRESKLLRASNHQPSIGPILHGILANRDEPKGEETTKESLLSKARQDQHAIPHEQLGVRRIERSSIRVDHRHPHDTNHVSPVLPPPQRQVESEPHHSFPPTSPPRRVETDPEQNNRDLELSPTNSSTASSKSVEAMRRKARLRRQRYGVHRSPHGAVVSRQAVTPTETHAYSPSRRTDAASSPAPPLKSPSQSIASPRSSFRDRRRLEQRRVRQEALRSSAAS